MGKYTDIQNDAVRRYRIDLCDGSKCSNDWARTHAHVKKRRVCKWIQKNSIQSTFELFHEIGHIETHKSYMRRAESEYYATVFAIQLFREYEMTVPHRILEDYQEYIDMEVERGKRRGGRDYPIMNIFDFEKYGEMTL